MQCFYCKIFLGQFNVLPIIARSCSKQSSIKADCIIYNQQIIFKAAFEIYFNRKQLFNFNIRMFGKNILEQPHDITFFPFLSLFSLLLFPFSLLSSIPSVLFLNVMYFQKRSESPWKYLSSYYSFNINKYNNNSIYHKCHI